MSLTFSVQQSDAMTCTGTSILPADADWVKKLGGSRCTKVKSWGWKPFEPRLMHLSWAESLLCLLCFCSFSLLLCFHCQVSPLESCSYKLFISIADLGGICGVTKYLVLTITCIVCFFIVCFCVFVYTCLPVGGRVRCLYMSPLVVIPADILQWFGMLFRVFVQPLDLYFFQYWLNAMIVQSLTGRFGWKPSAKQTHGM